MRLVIANSALRASLAIYHLLSNARSWNNCQLSLSVIQLTKEHGLIIYLFHNGGQIKYSFDLMLMSFSSFATTSKFQKNICSEMRAVGLIYMDKKG